jgi:hypothetical protein
LCQLKQNKQLPNQFTMHAMDKKSSVDEMKNTRLLNTKSEYFLNLSQESITCTNGQKDHMEQQQC